MKTIPIGILVTALAACAHQPKASDPQMEKMARMHTDMASCLRTNKSFDECHKEMMLTCQKEGSEACPMMKGPMPGKMGMMNHPEPAKTNPTALKDDEHAAHHPENSK